MGMQAGMVMQMAMRMGMAMRVCDEGAPTSLIVHSPLGWEQSMCNAHGCHFHARAAVQTRAARGPFPHTLTPSVNPWLREPPLPDLRISREGVAAPSPPPPASEGSVGGPHVP